jgi:hypothetical protein
MPLHGKAQMAAKARMRVLRDVRFMKEWGRGVCFVVCWGILFGEKTVCLGQFLLSNGKKIT